MGIFTQNSKLINNKFISTKIQKMGSHKQERKTSHKATTKCSAHSFEKNEKLFLRQNMDAFSGKIGMEIKAGDHKGRSYLSFSPASASYYFNNVTNSVRVVTSTPLR